MVSKNRGPGSKIVREKGRVLESHLEAVVQGGLRQNQRELPDEKDGLHLHRPVPRQPEEAQRRLEQLARQLLKGAQEHRGCAQAPQDERLHACVRHAPCAQ